MRLVFCAGGGVAEVIGWRKGILEYWNFLFFEGLSDEGAAVDNGARCYARRDETADGCKRTVAPAQSLVEFPRVLFHDSIGRRNGLILVKFPGNED